MHREVPLLFSRVRQLARGLVSLAAHPGRVSTILLSLLLTAGVSASTVTYTYDEAGRLKATTYSNGASTSYSLDAAGNRKLVQTTPAPALPSAPGVPAFTNVTATTATVSWAAATGIVASYSYSVNSGAWVNVGSAQTASLSGLTTGTTYSVAVIATNLSGNGPSNSASFTTLPPLPGAPGVPTFSNIATITATVSWTAASGTVASYSYSVNSGAWTNVGAALSANLTGLTGGTTYTVQVIASNPGGNGPASSASFTTSPPPPGVPSFTNVTTTTATVSWTAASGTVASYSYSVNSGAWTNVGTALSANLTGLTAGTVYTVQVVATNLSGNSPASSASFTTPALPGAPGIPSFTNITQTAATASWAAASGTVTSYSYSVNSGAWINVGTALSANLTGLTAGTSYTVQVIATTASGNSAPSTASFSTLPPPPSAPGAPSFTNITTTTATVSWTAASGTVASYSYSVNSGAWTNVGAALSANLTGLTAGTTYTVQVIATNPSGNGPASSASFTTLPSAPGIPSFTNITQTAATASWAAASGSVTSYSYSVNSGAWINVGTALSANLTGLTAGTTYTVQVLATNASGNSVPSTASFSTLQPPPSAPGTPSFTSITATTATASWTAASGTVASYSYSVNSGAWTNVGTALSANLTGLTGGTTYTVQVIATNPGGNGPASSASLTTLPPPPSAPGVPSFTNVTPNTATVQWTAASGTVTSYSYSVNSGGWINVGTALSAGLSGLSASTTYTVQVVATNSSGNGPASSGSFTTSSTYSDTPTMTEGNTTPTGTGGFLSGSFGSMSPATTTNGYTYTSLYDKWAGGMAQTYSFSAFSVAGFAADPGQGWLTSATAQGVTFAGASATYSYASGTATWTWRPLNGFGFNGTGTTVCTIVHK